MPTDIPLGAEVAASVILLIAAALGMILHRIVKNGDDRSRLPSDYDPNLSAVLAAIEDLKTTVIAQGNSEQQRMESLVRCLTRQREQQEIDDRFEQVRREIEKLRDDKT